MWGWLEGPKLLFIGFTGAKGVVAEGNRVLEGTEGIEEAEEG